MGRIELFVGIEFVREGLEVRVQTVTSILEFLHGENGGLKGMRESVGLHAEMESGMRCEGSIAGNLTFDGTSKGLGDFTSKIVTIRRVAMILYGGFETLFVNDIFPSPASV